MRKLCHIGNLAAFACPIAILALANAAAAQSTLLTTGSSASAWDRYTATVHELAHIVPKKAKVEWDLAEKARRQSRPVEAMQHFEQAIAIDPEFVAARNNLAVLQFKSDNVEAGIAQLEAAITLDPQKAILFSNLALGYVALENPREAERAARVAVRLDRGSVHSRMVLGVVLIQEHKYTDETVRCLEAAQDDYPAARLLLSRLPTARGDHSPAKDDGEK